MEQNLSNLLCFALYIYFTDDDSIFYGLWCFTESVCPTRIPVASRDEKGFELMLGMKIHQKAKEVKGSLLSEKAYLLNKADDITEKTRYDKTTTTEHVYTILIEKSVVVWELCTTLHIFKSSIDSI